MVYVSKKVEPQGLFALIELENQSFNRLSSSPTIDSEISHTSTVLVVFEKATSVFQNGLINILPGLLNFNSLIL